MSRSAPPDDAFDAWRQRAADADILEFAVGGIVNAQLRKKSREYVGPCPMCGGGSNEKGRRRAADGFAVNPGKRVFNCRRGGVGGDVIAMVMHTRGVPFNAACELITGEPPPARGSVISEETRRKSEQLQAEAAERERRRIEDENIYRAREIGTLRNIYDQAHPFAGSSAEIYAGIRGLTFPPAPADRAAPIKCVEAIPYHIDKDTIVHRGPAMVAPIINAKREFQGLHFTYLDPAREKGKLQLEHQGEPLDAKKSRGSKQGNFVALCGPIEPQFLVIGEAIEKTIAVYMALNASGRDLSAAAFWSACDLGNLSGKAAGSVTHPMLKSEKTGRPIKVPGGAPDLTEPAIDIPDSVTDLVLLGDSTSDPFATRLAMSRAAARYARRGRTVRIAWAPDGADFDDLLRETREDKVATAAALERIAGMVDAAPVFVDVVEDPAAIAEAIRKFCRAEVDAAAASVSAAEGEQRGTVLSTATQRLGQALGAGADDLPKGFEGFARITLEIAAGNCGLVRDDGMKAVKAAIGDGIKLGKEKPLDLSHVRREVSAQRPREAADVASVSRDVDGTTPAAPHPVRLGLPQSLDSKRPSDADGLSREVILECSREPQNDTGNGKRLLKHFGTNLLHVRSIGWYTWAGTHWEGEGGSEAATRCAQVTAARIALEADVMTATPYQQKLIDDADAARIAIDKSELATSSSSAERQKLARVVKAGDGAASALEARQISRRKYSVSSGNTGKIDGMLTQALPHSTLMIDGLDADDLAVNVMNCTIRFVCDEVPDPDGGDYSEATLRRYRVEIAEHNRADNITKEAPVMYDPDAKCPAFDEAVKRFLPIAPIREFVQRYHGYALTGLTGEQCLVFNYGTGSNWKSTFIEIIARIMGPYCAMVAFESLSGDQQRSGSQATPDLARLPGARLVRSSEPDRGVQFKEALIKSLTGGEPMLVRNNYENFFEFRPKFKMALSGNHKPEIGGVDHGIWRRMRFVPWPVTITEKEKRPMDDVIAELFAERSGILNWLIAGALDYLNNGLQTPQEVIDATAEYRDEMDPVGAFVGMCIETVPSNPDGSSSTSFVSARQMYDAFVAWAIGNAVRPWREKSFSTVMSQKGFAKERHKSGVRYLNVSLKNVPDTPRRRAGAAADAADSHDPGDIADVAM